MKKYIFNPKGKHVLPIGKRVFGPGSVVELDEEQAQRIIAAIPGHPQVDPETNKTVEFPSLIEQPDDAKVVAIPPELDVYVPRVMPRPEETSKVPNRPLQGFVVPRQKAEPQPADAGGEPSREDAPAPATRRKG